MQHHTHRWHPSEFSVADGGSRIWEHAGDTLLTFPGGVHGPCAVPEVERVVAAAAGRAAHEQVAHYVWGGLAVAIVVVALGYVAIGIAHAVSRPVWRASICALVAITMIPAARVLVASVVTEAVSEPMRRAAS